MDLLLDQVGDRSDDPRLQGPGGPKR